VLDDNGKYQAIELEQNGGGLLARSGADAALAGGAGWVKASALPPSPRLVQTLLQKGWIETTKSGPKNVVLYRLTEEGLKAKKLSIPIRQRKPSNSD
jgi:hypothetical protein